jgi:hypothetical protein
MFWDPTIVVEKDTEITSLISGGWSIARIQYPVYERSARLVRPIKEQSGLAHPSAAVDYDKLRAALGEDVIDSASSRFRPTNLVTCRLFFLSRLL